MMKAHLLLLSPQASLPNSLPDTAQMLSHKILKACRQKMKLKGVLLGRAALLVSTAPFLKYQERINTICPCKYFLLLTINPTLHLAAPLQPPASEAVLPRTGQDRVCHFKLPTAHRRKRFMTCLSL